MHLGQLNMHEWMTKHPANLGKYYYKQVIDDNTNNCTSDDSGENSKVPRCPSMLPFTKKFPALGAVKPQLMS